ncbi:NAD(P)/FAD-dependent oxidoreductase [Candidatus Poribacteria bacterium]|nr:NAD(P)/FAD-dependent oxidoreductase [Candidatus Poribacteria bacterium]
MASRTIVILGGGIGGIVAANELRRELPREHRIVLIERNAEHAFAASFLWVMVGGREPRQIVRPVRDLVSPGVELVHASVQRIDTGSRRVEHDAGSQEYDYLIVALGAELAQDAVPGLAEAAHTFYSLDGAIRLREALAAFTGGRVVLVVGGLPYKCPGAPHEGAMLIADYLRKRRLGDSTTVVLFTPEPQPMAVAGPELGSAVVSMLESRGIAFHPRHVLKSVDAQARQLHFDGKEPVPYDLLVTIPPHRSPRLLRESGLTNDAGWVPVDPQTLQTSVENIYAIGDVTALALPGRWNPDVPLALPKAGVFAHAQAKIVASRIAEQVRGGSSAAVFCGDGYCMLEAGEDLAGFAYGNFFAEPSPQVHLRRIGKAWHWGKVLFEKWWLSPLGLRRKCLGAVIRLGGGLLRIPGDL